MDGSQNQNLYQIKEKAFVGVDMGIIDVVQWIQALLVLIIFLGIVAIGFKVWRWNYSVPHK
jgi:hypothetical protein